MTETEIFQSRLKNVTGALVEKLFLASFLVQKLSKSDPIGVAKFDQTNGEGIVFMLTEERSIE